MKKTYILPLLGLLFIACDTKQKDTLQEQVEENVEKVVETKTSEEIGARIFWNTLKSYCGKAFEGEVIKAPENDDFRGKKLVMHLLSCSDNEIFIPFNVGENRSRTWVLRYIDGKIELKHDHRHEDGSDDEVTMYGGTTTNSGLPDIAAFPADEETRKIIPAAATNIWWITVKDSVYAYNLRRLGTDREFSIAFDLTKEVEIPEPSWGWEEYSKNL